jgi:hypothetical protein
MRFESLSGITPQEYWANDRDKGYGERMAESIERYIILEMSPDFILGRFREIGCIVTVGPHSIETELAVVIHPDVSTGVFIDIKSGSRGKQAFVRVDKGRNFEKFLVLMERCATSPVGQGAVG